MTTATPDPVQWHWIITLHRQAPDGTTETNTIDGTCSLSRATRREVYAGILAEAKRAAGWDGRGPVAVLFFSLEPDDLAAAAPAGPQARSDP